MRYLIFLAMALLGCTDDSPPAAVDSMYFPPTDSDQWETVSPSSLQWDATAQEDLITYLEQKNTKAFLVLVDGRIAMEVYLNGHNANSPWYWASAGKTLTATVTGIAEQEGLLSLNAPVSQYLGNGWTSAPAAKENLITVRHLLTMTSGLNDALGDAVHPANLQYVADAGTRWAYHNVYVKLQDVVAQSSGTSWNTYFASRLRDRIGMNGQWLSSGEDLSVYWSTARSMARFGLLALNRGRWENEIIINESFFADATTTSQNLNQAYGYLWWLNGKESYRLPQLQFSFQGTLIPAAPADMVMALGKNDQKIYVVPSKKMVIVRMGNAADDVNMALSDFDNVLWQKIQAMLP